MDSCHQRLKAFRKLETLSSKDIESAKLWIPSSFDSLDSRSKAYHTLVVILDICKFYAVQPKHPSFLILLTATMQQAPDLIMRFMYAPITRRVIDILALLLRIHNSLLLNNAAVLHETISSCLIIILESCTFLDSSFWTKIDDDRYTEFVGSTIGNGLVDRHILKGCIILYLKLENHMLTLSSYATLHDALVVSLSDIHEEELLDSILNLFLDNDSHLTLILSRSLEIYSNSSVKQLSLLPEPEKLFSRFICKTGYDSSLLLDLILSDIDFLEVFLKLLRFFCTLEKQLESGVISVLVDLRESVLSHHKRGLFPFNPSVLVERIQQLLLNYFPDQL